MRVLVIWCEIPERTIAYLLEDITTEQHQVLLDANNTFINSDDDCAAAEILSTAFGSVENADPKLDKKWHGLWHECEVPFPVSDIDLVVCSGFYL
jgi:hypothetical protein